MILGKKTVSANKNVIVAGRHHLLEGISCVCVLTFKYSSSIFDVSVFHRPSFLVLFFFFVRHFSGVVLSRENIICGERL